MTTVSQTNFTKAAKPAQASGHFEAVLNSPAHKARVARMDEAEAKAASRKEKAIRTTRINALTLIEQGYSFHAWEHLTGRFDCVTPTHEHQQRRADGRPLVYTLDMTMSADGLSVQSYTCDCEMYGNAELCKHGECLKAEIIKAIALAKAVVPGLIFAATAKTMNDLGVIPGEPKPGDFNRFDRADFDARRMADFS